MTALLTRPEVAKRLRVSERTLDRLVAAGDMAVVKVGRGLRFRPEHVEAYLTAATR